MPNDRQGKIRYWLEGMGIVVDKTPTGKRGTWLKSSDIVALIGADMSEQDKKNLATKLAKDLGDGVKISTAWAAPFDRVLEELSLRNQLTSEAQTFWQEVRIAAA
jgi:hypothetical protein